MLKSFDYYKGLPQSTRAQRSEQYLEFRNDLFEHYGVADNPKAVKAFTLAWEYGHANGFADIDYYFNDLVQLIKDD